MLIHPLGCSVTEHPLKVINVFVSLILFMKHVITNTKLLAFCVTIYKMHGATIKILIMELMKEVTCDSHIRKKTI